MLDRSASLFHHDPVMGYHLRAEAAAGPRAEGRATRGARTPGTGVGSGYRYYSPELGRWLSRDPIGERGGANLLSFLGNNLVTGTDSLGLMVLDMGTFRSRASLGPFGDSWPIDYRCYAVVNRDDPCNPRPRVSDFVVCGARSGARFDVNIDLMQVAGFVDALKTGGLTSFLGEQLRDWTLEQLGVGGTGWNLGARAAGRIRIVAGPGDDLDQWRGRGAAAPVWVYVGEEKCSDGVRVQKLFEVSFDVIVETIATATVTGGFTVAGRGPSHSHRSHLSDVIIASHTWLHRTPCCCP